jgi:A118 family predicted phage portal protein
MSLWNKIKELVRKMLPKKTVEDVLHVTPCISDRMAEAITLWSDMYEGNSPWLREPTPDNPARIVSLGLPALIASEKARMVTLEMKTEINAPMAEVELAPEMPTGPEEGMFTNDAPTGNAPTQAKPQSNLGTGVQPAVGADTQETVQGGANSIPLSSAYRQKTQQVPTGPTERADFLNGQYKKLCRQIRRQLEYGVAKGGLVIKPYIVMYDSTPKFDSNAQSAQNAQSAGNAQNIAPDDVKSKDKQTIAQNNNNTPSKPESTPAQSGRMQYNNNLSNAEIEFDYIQADRFFPLSFDANGKVIEAAFIQTKVDKAKDRVYIRLEYHKLEKRTVTVQNLAFESTDMSLANSNNIKSASNLGRQISLKEVPEWASLQPTTVIEGVDRLLFAYFRMPEANTVDPYSPLGVSGYSRVVQLIKDADMQYSRLLWEFEAGEMAIDVDRDALKFVTDPNGEGYSTLPEKQQRLFRKVDLNQEDTYEVFAPALRDASIVHGLNTIFMRIEDSVGLSRGTLSDVNTQEAKTATELKILKQRSYATNADIQMALQDALSDVVYVMDVYATLYEVTPPGEYEVSFEWDDSIIVDSESELSKRITLMQNGLASKLETRMWYFGETENQARAAMMQIEEESTQAMMQNVQAEQMKAMAFGNNLPEEDEEEEDTEGDPTKSPADKTSAKVSKGKQADDLDNPVKGKNNPNQKH